MRKKKFGNIKTLFDSPMSAILIAKETKDDVVKQKEAKPTKKSDFYDSRFLTVW